MSTLKSVGNKLFKTDLSNHKVELAVGDELIKISSKTETLRKKLNSEIGNAFEPIRRIEKIISNLPNEIDGFKEFKNSLMDMEKQYSEDNRKIQDAEKDLGVKIERPKALDNAIKELQEFQKWEEIFRKDINEFNKEVKKYK